MGRRRALERSSAPVRSLGSIGQLYWPHFNFAQIRFISTKSVSKFNISLVVDLDCPTPVHLKAPLDSASSSSKDLLIASESIPLPNSRSSPSVRSVINSMVCTHTQQCTHCFTLLCTHRIPGSHENTRRHQSHQGYLVASMMSSDRRHQRRRRPRWKICGCKPTLVDVRQKRSRADSYP